PPDIRSSPLHAALPIASRQSRMVRAPLYVHTTTEIRGHGRLGENGTSANASRTALSAGLGDRSTRVRPKAQSSTSWPCRYHSSVDRKSTRLNSSHQIIS